MAFHLYRNIQSLACAIPPRRWNFSASGGTSKAAICWGEKLKLVESRRIQYPGTRIAVVPGRPAASDPIGIEKSDQGIPCVHEVRSGNLKCTHSQG